MAHIIEPLNPSIKQIARQFNLKYKHVPPLGEIIDGAMSGNSKAKRFLERNEILVEGARELRETIEEEPFPYIPFLDAVAVAQIYLRRENKEVVILKRYIVKNYPKDLQCEVTNSFLQIAESFEANEINFINYIIDNLKGIYLAKEFAKEEGFSQKDAALLTLGDFEEDLIDGSVGFSLDAESSEYVKTVELILLAAKTPL